MTDEIRPEGDEGVSDPEALHLTREESRAVLDRRLTELDEVNAKAMHTVRTAGVLLGLEISSLALLLAGGTAQFRLVPVLVVGSGTSCLLLAIVAGIITYSSSGVPEGASRSYRDDVREGNYDEVGWLLVLLGGYDQWVDGVNRGKRRTERRLLMAIVLLVLGLLLVVSGISLYVIGP